MDQLERTVDTGIYDGATSMHTKLKASLLKKI